MTQTTALENTTKLIIFSDTFGTYVKTSTEAQTGNNSSTVAKLNKQLFNKTAAN